MPCNKFSQRSAITLMLTSLLVGLPLGLTGCSEPSETPKNPTPKNGKTPANNNPPVVSITEDDLVSADDQKRFVDNAADTTVKFPEAEFQEGRKFLQQQKPADGERVLKSKLDDAVKSAAGQTRLGQYCVRLNNNLFMEDKHKEALKYNILAMRIFYKQSPEQRPLPFWFFNVHLYQAMGYKKLRMWPEAEKQYRKAINIAASAPTGQIDFNWYRLCYLELIDTLLIEKKKAEADLVKKDLKALEATHH